MRLSFTLGLLVVAIFGPVQAAAEEQRVAPAAADHMAVVENVLIPMRDGVLLAADLYLPARRSEAVPVIIEVTPYGRRLGGYFDEAPYWTANGYAFLAVDARGQGESGGEFHFLRDAGPDNHDVIEWAAGQEWSTGKVAMRGSSFTGSSQYLAAIENPPGLKCVVPNAVVTRPFEDLVRNGGAFKLRWAAEWLAILSDSGVDFDLPGPDGKGGFDYQDVLGKGPLIELDQKLTGVNSRLFDEFVSNDVLNSYWRDIRIDEQEFSRIDIPVLTFTGWFDGTLPGTVYGFQGMQRNSPADDRAFLVIGPWQHGTLTYGGTNRRTGQPVRTVGDMSFPDHAFLDGLEITRRFFDWCLKDGPQFVQPAALIYVTGSDLWVEAATYPLAADLTPFYLSAPEGRASLAQPGRLGRARPGAQEPSRFVYDPMNPVPESVPTANGDQVRLQSMPVDLTPILDRDDVIVFESEVLTEPLTVIGNVKLMLWAATDAKDTDFTSHIADVRPDGRAIKLGPQSGANARARYRQSLTEETPVVPGAPFEIALDYYDIGHTFLPGHKIRISISSSNYPWISANPNTGNPIATDTAPPVVARQSVFHDRLRPSRLLLPVVDLAKLRKYRHD